MMRPFVGCLLALGCSSRPLYLSEPTAPGSPLPDLTVASVRDLTVAPDLLDLSAPDLTSPPDLAQPQGDLAGFCSGTPIAGTCFQEVFASAARCYDPAGSCTVGPQIIAFHSYCYSNGAKATLSESNSDDWIFRNSAGVVCYTLRLASWETRISDGVLPVDFDPETGDYSCDPMAAHPITGSVGPNCGGCAEACALFHNQPTGCTDGDDNCR
jgi:hypothetical protein